MSHEERRQRERARAAVANAKTAGLLPRARGLACADCGGSACDYDHWQGYARKDWLNVQPVCKPCHVRRGVAQRSAARERHEGHEAMTTGKQGEPLPGDRWYRVKDAQDYLGISRATLTRYVSSGKLKAYRLGGVRGELRFRRADLDALLEVDTDPGASKRRKLEPTQG